MINWEQLKQKHNYPSVRRMLKMVHKKHGSLPRAAKFLGISRKSLRLKMKAMGFKFKWGGSRVHKKILDSIPPERFKEYTIGELAQQAGCHPSTVRRYLRNLQKVL